MTVLSHRCNHFELDCDWRRQRAHLNRGASRIWFARACKIFGVETVVDRKILFHVSEKHRDIDDVLPGRASVLQHKPYIFEYRTTLRFDIVTDDIAGRIERDAGNFLAAADARPDPGEKQQLADTLRVRKRAYRLGRARTFKGVLHSDDGDPSRWLDQGSIYIEIMPGDDFAAVELMHFFKQLLFASCRAALLSARLIAARIRAVVEDQQTWLRSARDVGQLFG